MRKRAHSYEVGKLGLACLESDHEAELSEQNHSDCEKEMGNSIESLGSTFQESGNPFMGCLTDGKGMAK